VLTRLSKHFNTIDEAPLTHIADFTTHLSPDGFRRGSFYRLSKPCVHPQRGVRKDRFEDI